jgi:p-hydroxybenzoate 3-monooxygenase
VRTQVGIVGAGPAGLLLAQLLHLEGIESVVLELRDRAYVEQRVRAGLLEQGTVDLLVQTGVGERLQREALVHDGIYLQFDGRRTHIPITELTGASVFIYGQQEVVKDLIAARLAYDGPLLFEVSEVALAGIDGDRPRITFVDDRGAARVLDCDLIAGCDGFHGICRPSIPAAALRPYERAYPFAWLGILAAVPPSTDALIYANHERGFALHSMRSTTISRLYLQVEADEELAQWPDRRIWEELSVRFALEGWTLERGELLEKALTPMRSFVVEPMQWGRLLLAGDAAHIVPPTGAKGLNLAVHDVDVLSRAIAVWYGTGAADQLAGYSRTALRRVWRAQEFSGYMTTLLHRMDGDEFDARLQRARLEYVCRSQAAARSLAENYAGIAGDSPRPQYCGL